MKKKILSLLLAVVMLISVMPMSAMTASAATNWSGSVGYHDLDNNHTIAKGTSIKANSSSAKGNMYVYLDGSCVRNVSYNSTYTTDRCTKVSSWENKSNNMYLYLVTNCPSFTSRTCTQSQHCTTCGWVKNAAYGHDYTNYRDGGEATAATCTTAATHYKMCYRCTSKSGTYTYSSALGHDYTNYRDGGKKSDATCTVAETHYKMCYRCSITSGTYTVGSPKAHSYTKRGSLVSEATIDSPAIYNKQCATCTATSGTMEVGDKLSSAYIKYFDPVTNVEVVVEPTNDTVKTEVEKLMKKPMQKEKQIFTGWYTPNGALDKSATRFDQLTEITAQFTSIGKFNRDKHNDEKNIDEYLDFGLAGAQIRSDNTAEKDTQNYVYGGLRFVASFSDDLINRIGYSNIVEYGFVVATKGNADANAYGNSNYVIKSGDQNVKRINCMTGVDHRNFGYYRLFTMVIDYEGNESLKSQELVVRPYIIYYDANGIARIFYGSYEGTNTYGGMAMSYNEAMSYTSVTV